MTNCEKSRSSLMSGVQASDSTMSDRKLAERQGWGSRSLDKNGLDPPQRSVGVSTDMRQR